MKWLLRILLFSPLLAVGCEYSDDPRLSDERIGSVVEQIKAGNKIRPIRMKVSTYLYLGPNSRELLEPHIRISDINCDPVAFFEGEIVTQAVVGFEEYYRLMAYAIHEDKPALAKNVFQRLKVQPMPVDEFQQLFGLLPYKGSHGVSTRNKMKNLFPGFKSLHPQASHLEDPVKEGRLRDYTMAKLFRIFGGELLLDKGCGPYALADQFHDKQKVSTVFGERDVTVTRRKPVQHLMRMMGYRAVREDTITFRIDNCDP